LHLSKPANNNSILILSAAAGAGHIRAADALVSAFSMQDFPVEHIEVLKYTTPIFRKVYSDLYIELINKRPEILGWVYNSLNRPWKLQKRRLAMDLLNTGPLVKLLKKTRPSAAICTHFLPPELLVYLKKKRLIDFPIGVVITDYDAHAMWLYKDVDWYFVACEETKVHLEKLGIPPATIHVTGIPIDPVFAKKQSKQDARMKLGLSPDMTTVLVSVGGFGVGPMEMLIRSIDEVQTPIQIIVICGKNEKIKNDMVKLKTRNPKYVIGFTKEMESYMAASNILVGKAGGLTSSEAFARGLILVAVNPVPGQEERNCDHFLEEGVALRCNNLPALGFKIDSLLQDTNRMTTMQKNIKRFAHPLASEDIASIIIRDLGAPR
jgi:processive 1,2-diacylglycerol beta-glucosyltransferase